MVLVIILLLTSGLLWDRFRSSTIPERYLKIPGLETICQEYLDTIKQMNSGLYTTEEIYQLDSQRQWLHNEILFRLELERDSDLDVMSLRKNILAGLEKECHYDK